MTREAIQAVMAECEKYKSDPRQVSDWKIRCATRTIKDMLAKGAGDVEILKQLLKLLEL